MPGVNWTFIKSEILSNHTSWIQTLSKENLLEVCTHYGISADDSHTVDSLRTTLNKCVKTVIQENTKTENKSPTKSNSTTNSETKSKSRKQQKCHC